MLIQAPSPERVGEGGPAVQSSGRSAAPRLRPYQVEQLGGVHHELEVAGHRSTLVVAATGTGKTVSFSELTRLEASRGGKTLILVGRDELVRQTRKKCEAVGLAPDVEKAQRRASTLAKVVIASVQSLRGARLKRWARDHFAKVIVDEAHHAVAAGYRAILDHFETAKVVGYTATPERADRKPLGDVFESVAHRYEIREAIAAGYLVPIVARRVVVDSIDLSDVKDRAGDFAQDQLAEVMADERALRGQAVPLLELASDRLTIAFCVNVAHAHALARVLNSYRPGCARAVSGETGEDERERTIEAFARREFQFLCNCDVLVEGFDCPEVSCVAVCRPTRSRGRFIQCGGRGLRLFGDTLAESRAKGKHDCLILTFTDAKMPGLCGPADCLAGVTELTDDVRAEIDRLIGTAQLDIAAVIDQADEIARARRDALVISAVVAYHAENVDPFIGTGGTVPPFDPSWRNDLATERQLEALAKDGVTVTKLPVGFSRVDAWKLLARIRGRAAQGLCSYKAARKLASAGVRDTTKLTAPRAKELLDLLRLGGWRPSAIADQPEIHGETTEIAPAGEALEWGTA